MHESILRSVPIAPLTLGRLAERLVRGWAGAQRRRRIARTVRALETMGDAELAAMGVPRGRIRDIAREIEDQGHRAPGSTGACMS